MLYTNWVCFVFYMGGKKCQKEEKVKVSAEFTLVCLDLQIVVIWRRGRSGLVLHPLPSNRAFFSKLTRPVSMREWKCSRENTCKGPENILVSKQVRAHHREVNSEVTGGSALELTHGRWLHWASSGWLQTLTRWRVPRCWKTMSYIMKEVQSDANNEFVTGSKSSIHSTKTYKI